MVLLCYVRLLLSRRETLLMQVAYLTWQGYGSGLEELRPPAPQPQALGSTQPRALDRCFPSSREKRSLADAFIAVCDQRILRSCAQIPEPQKL